MNNRSNDLIQIRPEIKKTLSFKKTNKIELFQNTTLRPILKLQNLLLIEAFRNYINIHKGVFYNLGISNRLNYIENALLKNQKFQNSIKGMIIGHFTIEEYQRFNQDSSELNKRIMSLVISRLKDQEQLFKKNP